jgi:sirohydrochlorin ferrochelatase
MRCYLVDNGSLRPDSYRNLRQVAAALSSVLGETVLPVSLLHSSKIDPALLDGEAAMTVERQIRLDMAVGHREFAILPFFFGATGALTDYLPERLASLRQRYGPCTVIRGPFLYSPALGLADDLLPILVERVRTTMASHALTRPPVILVDHGSPLRSVTTVRDELAGALAAALGDSVAGVAAASMERRDGPEYAFNEPLLARQLTAPGFASQPVVVALLFLSPGRHAGPDGDIATICATAQAADPQLQPQMTGLVGTHPAIVEVLAARYRHMLRLPVIL